MRTRTLPVVVVLAFAPLVLAGPTPPLAPDIPAKFVTPARDADHERRDVMIPMRDGVKLHTVILVPKGAKRAPMMLTRTPYNANRRSTRSHSDLMAANAAAGDDVIRTVAPSLRLRVVPQRDATE